METILIIDDDADLRFNLSNILTQQGYNIIASDGRKALKQVEKDSPNLVLLDIKLPGMDGMKILEQMRGIDKDLIIIMLTAYSDVKNAVKSMKLGAYDYLTKPFDTEELLLTIKKALQTQYLSKEVDHLRRRLGEKIMIEQMLGESAKINKVLKQVNIIAPTNLTVILQGASGTGKELIAQLIHQKSPRRDKPFIPVDCGAIPPTLVESTLFGHEKGAFSGADTQKPGEFEQANQGTLFFDEITNLSDTLQMKFLRVLEERKCRPVGGRKDKAIDVRIVVATNIGLYEAVKSGRFRQDLFHRLNEFTIDLPLLRERREDIPILAERFLEEANQQLTKKIKGFSPPAMKMLLNYDWPGNVRELKNVVKKAVLTNESDYIELVEIPLNLAGVASSDVKPDENEGIPLRQVTQKATKQIERDLIKQVLSKVDGNKAKASKILQIDRMTLYSKIKEFQL